MDNTTWDGPQDPLPLTARDESPLSDIATHSDTNTLVHEPASPVRKEPAVAPPAPAPKPKATSHVPPTSSSIADTISGRKRKITTLDFVAVPQATSRVGPPKRKRKLDPKPSKASPPTPAASIPTKNKKTRSMESSQVSFPQTLA
ncbi:hypothetical protein FA95DRAFT_1608230 [Auriscalpium vulgare]|uniref:Uncharacterized protein n=1 Tax=Auriscalpium vulgare TaxID=40419 RepID=A0ACB8RLM2_9AGAM|nr:hypothetical protein FA95DRAFT_1608230 [Auriscalpium vulgare]